jgi:uncharacterized protein YpmB
MKKLIAALTLLLAFSINANAQDTKPSTAPKSTQGQADADELTKLVGLNQTQNADYARLFEHKYKTLENKDLSQERKDVLARVIEDKMRAGLDAKQNDLLDKNPELLKKLTH